MQKALKFFDCLSLSLPVLTFSTEVQATLNCLTTYDLPTHVTGTEGRTGYLPEEVFSINKDV